MENKKEETTLGIVGEVGVFGSLNMQDPTVNPVDEILSKTDDPNLKAYLKEQKKVRSV